MNLFKVTNEENQNLEKELLKIYLIPFLSKSKSNMSVEIKAYKSSDMFKVAGKEYLGTLQKSFEQTRKILEKGY